MSEAKPPDEKPEDRSVLRPTDDEARRLAKGLVRAARFGSLATIEAGSGHPFASLTAVATDIDGAPVILVSKLSGHTVNLAADPRCSLLLGQPGKGDPLAHPRVTVICVANRLFDDDLARARRRFLAKHPKAALYVDFPDFNFLRLQPGRASLNGGFGRAYVLFKSDLMTDLNGAEQLTVFEESAVAHMNDDHAEALRLYATKLCGAPDGPWRCAGLDPEGLDLVAGDLAVRLDFPERIVDAVSLRKLLKRLADEARAKD